jgi:carboxyl-terminal processing protease
MNSTMKAIMALALSAIIAASGFIGGFVTARLSPMTSALESISAPADASRVGSRVDEVRALLNDQALEPPSETSATAGAIQGLLDSGGDKYAVYFDKKHYEYFNEETMGAFGGIGVVLGEKDGKAYIVEVYDGTPAKKAGVKSGDVFHTIDGVTRAKWTSDEVVKRVRGEEGTKFTIVMERPGKDVHADPALKTFTLTRAKIVYPNIKSELIGKVGYIRLGQFNAKSSDDVKAAIESLTKKGAKSFVLDLRDNPGGLLDQAVKLSSLFIDNGVIVRVDERGRPEEELKTSGRKITDAPLVVLINGNSASASEITGGALQDYARAKLVGEKSFGKGSVQTIEELPWGGAVKFTTAHYLTPKKRVINGKGLTPDVLVKMDAEKQADRKTDTQLAKALEIARSEAAKR